MRQRCARLCKPYMRGKVGEPHSRIDTALFIEDRTTKFVEVESSAALPTHSLRDAALLTIHDFLETGYAVRSCMFSHLNPDIAAAHFVRDSSGCARAEIGIHYQVPLQCRHL